MEPTIIDIGLVCVGSVVRVPITVCNDSSTTSIPDVSVLVKAPYGLQYVTASVPRGSFNSELKTWVIGKLNRDECIVGELQYIVVDDTSPEYNFTYTVSTTNNCSSCSDLAGCILLKGLSCSQLNKCNPGVAKSSRMLCGSGVDCSGDVSTNDGTCLVGLTKTYQWLDTDVAMGTIEGDPDSFIFTPYEGYCGIGTATYGLYCNGILYDRGDIRFDITCVHGVPDTYIFYSDNVTLDFSAGENDHECFFGANTTWNLVSNPAANGSGLTESTSVSEVDVTSWSQANGDFTVTLNNDKFSGNATFEYTIRCTDDALNVVYESDPILVTIIVTLPLS